MCLLPFTVSDVDVIDGQVLLALQHLPSRLWKETQELHHLAVLLVVLHLLVKE